jgi:hypothetical protein
LARSDRGAIWAWWFAVGAAFVVLLIVGRHQWFIRDDWAFLLTRERIGRGLGLDDMLLLPQDGHLMVWPILIYRGLHTVFGLGSYWPYLIVLWLTHLGIVLLVRRVCGRLDVSAWMTTLICSVLLVFGGGWENILFAIQITYNLSLLAFLAQFLLVDHDGPVDRRDWIGSGIAVIGVSSSGFGPFFAFGVGVLLAVRGRWKAAAIAVVPQALVWSWWWLTWGADPAGEQGSGTLTDVARFVRLGLVSTFASLTGIGMLAGAGILLTLAIVVWPRTGARRRAIAIALWATVIAMFVGVGFQRVGIGVETAASSRYQYIAAMLLAPVFAVGLDQAGRFAPWAVWLPRAMLVFALARNVMWLSDYGADWARRAELERAAFALLAGSPDRTSVDPSLPIVDFSPDVRVGDLDQLVDDGAITPVDDPTPDQQAVIDDLLGQPAGG